MKNNKNRHALCAIAVANLCAGIAFSGPQQAAPEGTNNDVESKAGVVDDNITYLTISGELARIAGDADDPILMLAAARLEAIAATTEEQREKVATGGSPTTADKPDESDLYSSAEQLAAGNESLLAVIADSKASGAPGEKGATYGGRNNVRTCLGVRHGRLSSCVRPRTASSSYCVG